MKKDNSSHAFYSELAERVIMLLLSSFLFAGSLVLYIRDSRPLVAISVESKGATDKLSLYEVEEALKEARKININTATAEDIRLIPGIGPAISLRIVEYRENNGYFYTLDSLLAVKGIGPSKLEKIREYISFD